MSLKESLQKKLETQTEYWSKQIDSLRAEADEKMAKAKDDQAEAEIQREFSERIQAVEDHIETARSKPGRTQGLRRRPAGRSEEADRRMAAEQHQLIATAKLQKAPA